MEELSQNNLKLKIQEILKNKYNLFFIGAIAILFIIIVMVLIVFNSSNEPESIVNPTPTQEKTSPSPFNQISPTPLTQADPTQAVIINQTKPQLEERITVPYDVSKTKIYGEEWAIIQVSNPDTDPANIVVQKENGSWVVKLGPGTYFDEAQLQAIGAPQSLIDEANTPDF